MQVWRILTSLHQISFTFEGHHGRSCQIRHRLCWRQSKCPLEASVQITGTAQWITPIMRTSAIITGMSQVMAGTPSYSDNYSTADYAGSTWGGSLLLLGSRKSRHLHLKGKHKLYRQHKWWLAGQIHTKVHHGLSFPCVMCRQGHDRSLLMFLYLFNLF